MVLRIPRTMANLKDRLGKEDSGAIGATRLPHAYSRNEIKERQSEQLANSINGLGDCPPGTGSEHSASGTESEAIDLTEGILQGVTPRSADTL